MAQLQQSSSSKPLEHCNDSTHNGVLYLKASNLKLEGNWNKHGTYAELLESSIFKVSGQCGLQGHMYVGHVVIGLTRCHAMGKVKIEASSPKQESEEDLTSNKPGILARLEIGLYGDEHFEFSLTSAEPSGKIQKGLIIYGITLTPVKI
ncbi:hypothetical protein DCAR_0205373 [Daucus carota subsp. sativus]|uniref:Uncharacterized protein n=1 Tax=Daucus carota subsp. sativus TaxID=79200 RepID=A0A166CKN4_DAUCS|nr:hypothetical protein DCAR_0205373 [Daucus carota subsp. sativus]